MFYIPVTAYPEQPMRIDLDGNAYNIRIYYSAYDDVIKEVVDDGREGKWYMDISQGQSIDNDELVNVKGIALVGGADLFEPYAYQALGSLFVIDTDNLSDDPDFENMGGRYKILYIEKSQQEDLLISIGYKNAII